MNRRTSQRGITIVEFILVVAIFALFSMVLTDVFMSSSSLVTSSRTEHRAQERLRRNMEAVSNVLRGAALDTLSGFNGAGEANTLQFARIDSVDGQGPIYLGSESLVWEPVAGSVDGVPAPGQIVHTLDGTRSVIATRVPQPGFTARLEEGALVIRMQTYYSSQGRAVFATGSTAVALRN
jgi:type II secretory pathway pseudopilin PulG